MSKFQECYGNLNTCINCRVPYEFIGGFKGKIFSNENLIIVEKSCLNSEFAPFHWNVSAIFNNYGYFETLTGMKINKEFFIVTRKKI